MLCCKSVFCSFYVVVIFFFFSSFYVTAQEKDFWRVQSLPFKEFKQELGKFEAPRFSKSQRNWVAYEVDSDMGRHLYIGNLNDSSSYEVTPSIVEDEQIENFSIRSSTGDHHYAGGLDWCPKLMEGKTWYVIVSSGDVSTNNELFLGNAENPKQLYQFTQNKALDFRPRWSPDGKSISYISTKTGASDVYLIRDVWGLLLRMREKINQGDNNTSVDSLDNGKWIERLTDTPNEENWQSWSSNGLYIVYGLLKDAGDENSENRIVAVNLFSKKHITLVSNKKYVLRNPTISFDGEYIAYYMEGGSKDLNVNLTVGKVLYNDKNIEAVKVTWTSKNVKKFRDITSDDNRGPIWAVNGSLFFVNSTRGWPYSIYEITQESFRDSASLSLVEHKIIKSITDPLIFLRELEIGNGINVEQDFMVSAIVGNDFGTYSNTTIKQKNDTVWYVGGMIASSLVLYLLHNALK